MVFARVKLSTELMVVSRRKFTRRMKLKQVEQQICPSLFPSKKSCLSQKRLLPLRDVLLLEQQQAVNSLMTSCLNRGQRNE